MKKLVVVAVALCCTFFARTQVIYLSNANQQLVQQFDAAYNQARIGNTTQAVETLNAILAKQPLFIDAILAKGDILKNNRNYSVACLQYQQANTLDSNFTKAYYLNYAAACMGTGNFALASSLLQKYSTQNLSAATVQKVAQLQYLCAFAAENKIKNAGYSFNPTNLGAAINSGFLEYFPSIAIDGKTFAFTRRNGSNEDVFLSEQKAGAWQTATPATFNTRQNEAAQNIAQNGSALVFTACDYPTGFGSCDIYICYQQNGTWGPAQNMGPAVNTEYWESSPCLSADMQTLYFASTRPGGYGGKDIWCVHKQPNGSWGQLENLGEAINTAQNEEGGFLHADGAHFYFTSDGKPGYGMRDIFMAIKVTDSTWQEAENLGYPINTIDDEGTLVVDAQGKKAYFNTDREGTLGGLDIYEFELPKKYQSFKSVWLSGRVLDTLTNLPIAATLYITEKTSGKKIILKADKTGYFFTTLLSGKEYIFNINNKGYLLYSSGYSTALAPDSVYNANLYLQPLAVGKSVVLKNIFFDNNLAVLKAESAAELNTLLALLTENPSLNITINGHTDNVGKPTDNLRLSTQRAQAVTNFLLKNGIAKNRLKTKGLGALKPIANNKTEVGRAQNRRTEIIVEKI
jgi:outer membrane protein OmpA-like peptidoglycan-associated protein